MPSPNSSSPSVRRKRTRGGKRTNRSSALAHTSTTRSPLRTRARSSVISTWPSVAPTSSKALPGVSVTDAPRVDRTRAPLSPHASTWRTSPASSMVKPVLLPMKVANSLSLLLSTPLVFRRSLWRDPRTIGCSDRLSGLGVEEAQPADVNGERDTVPGRDRHARIDPCDAFRRRRARDLPVHRGFCRPRARSVADCPRVRRVMDERFVAEDLDELDACSERRLSVRAPTLGDGQVLGTDPDHELASLAGDQAGGTMTEVSRK